MLVCPLAPVEGAVILRELRSVIVFCFPAATVIVGDNVVFIFARVIFIREAVDEVELLPDEVSDPELCVVLSTVFPVFVISLPSDILIAITVNKNQNNDEQFRSDVCLFCANQHDKM